VKDPLQTLLTALHREDDIGNRVHALDDVRHAIPLIVLMAGLDLEKLSPGTQELMLQASLAAGLDPLADPAPTPDETVSAFVRYFEAHPVEPAILHDIQQAFEGLEDGPSKAARALLGTEASTGVLGGGERPAGTIPAALGRLHTSLPTKKR